MKNKIFTNIHKDNFNDAFDNLDIIFKCGKQKLDDLDNSKSLYIRIYYVDEKPFYGFGQMGFLKSNEKMFSEYEPIDYSEWFEENEIIITATKFGL